MLGNNKMGYISPQSIEDYMSGISSVIAETNAQAPRNHRGLGQILLSWIDSLLAFLTRL